MKPVLWEHFSWGNKVNIQRVQEKVNKCIIMGSDVRRAGDGSSR